MDPNEKFNKNPSQKKWRRILQNIQKGFPSPWKEEATDQIFEITLKSAIAEANRLKHTRFHNEDEAFKGYLKRPDLPDYSQCKQARLKPRYTPHEEIIKEIIHYFEGMPNWGHPQTMSNVNPPPNTASIISSSLGNLFNPDIMEGEYSWNVAKTEIESGAMLAEMMGWDPEQAGGIYTSGGTSSYLYAMKLALTSVLGQVTRQEGIRKEAQVLVSAAGHYCKYTCADWLGLGMKNIHEIPIDTDGGMNIGKLKEAMQKCREEGKPIAMIVCTLGTTDSFSIDPIYAIRELINNYKNAKDFPPPLLYADAVIGWSWMAFKNYDFIENPLEFSHQALVIIKNNYEKISSIKFADAIGIDLHKTGWAPFNCSFFLVKEYSKFTTLMQRPLPPYLQFTTSYNPFIFTLETTRGASGALAGWAALKFFGYEGYQIMLGHIIEITLYLRELLAREKNIVCVNPNNYGFVTLFRVYPRHIDAKMQYEKELTDPSFRESLKAYNYLQQNIANKLFAMLRDPAAKIDGWENPPYTSYTQGYKTTTYAPQEREVDYLIHALKAFPMSPFSNEISALLIRNYVLKACDLVIDSLLENESTTHNSVEGSEEQVQNWFGKEKFIPREYLVPQSENYVTILSRIRLFSHLVHEQLEELITHAFIKQFPENTVLFQENDQSDYVYIILEGKIQIYRVDSSGQTIDISTLESGEIFGEMAVFKSGKRGANAKALTSVKCMLIKGDNFIQMTL